MFVVLRWITIFGLFGALASCGVVESNLIEDHGPYGSSCDSDAGFYYLPKTLIRVEVKRSTALDKSNKATGDPWHEISVQRLRVPDKRFAYCLDYLARINSDDIVQIKKYPKTNLLSVVTTDVLDQSRFIIESLIKTLFVGISGNPAYSFDTNAQRTFLNNNNGEATVFRAEFDPFDPRESSVINHALNDFGFCLVLDNYTFDPDHATINRYCDKPKRVQAASHMETPDYKYSYNDEHHTGRSRSATEARQVVRGIFYRPRIPYNYYLFIKKNPKVSGGWQLRSTAPVPMENVAPIVSVGLERALFTQRRTSLVFDEGMLGPVCVFKKSELLEAVQIPLVIVKSIVALPANVIMVRIDQANNKAALVKAQDELIKTQIRAIELERQVQNPTQTAYGSTSSGKVSGGSPAKSTDKKFNPGKLRPEKFDDKTKGQGKLWNEYCETPAKDFSTSATAVTAIGAQPE